MKNNLILTTFMLWCSFGLFAQNPVWVCPPNFVKNSAYQPLPTGPSSNQHNNPLDYYDTEFRLEGSANGISSPDGNLLFFIVDGLIYDGAGEFKDYAFLDGVSTISNSQSPVYKINYDDHFHIGPETVIVPHPVNCKQYFIFSSLVEQFIFKEIPLDTIPPTPTHDSNAVINTRPVYALYDANLGQVIDKGLWYSSESLTLQNPFANNPSIFTDNISDYIGTGDNAMFPSYWQQRTNLNSNLGLGATQTMPNGSRYIVCFLQNLFVILELKSDGSLIYHKRFETTTGDNSMKSSELELMLDSTSNEWVIATSTYLFGGGVQVSRLSEDMTQMLSTENVSLPLLNNYAELNGLEFSPDHSKLLLTYSHSSTLSVSNLSYIDLNTNPLTAIPLANLSPSDQEIAFGFIEKSGNNIFISSENGLYLLNNPNNPNTANLSSTPVIQMPIDVANTGNAIQTFCQYFYPLPDQIDEMDYYSNFYTDATCCKNSIQFDKNTFSAISNATWLPGFGSNPLDAVNDGNNVITIRDELRIPKGKVITISNMELRFAPGAKLIIEQGDASLNGGRLTLNNSKLTVDQRCTDNEMWEGIEVWGDKNAAQGSLFGNSKQGRLIIQNNSTIEHAERAILAGSLNNNGNYDIMKGGGIVSASNSTFLNNQRDITWYNYSAPNNVNNLSMVSNCSFLINNTLKGNLIPMQHCYLMNVKGIKIYGSTFSHTNHFYQQIGDGIFARNSSFIADARCTSGSTPCTSYDPNVFENLRNGIRVSNTNTALPFSSDRNEFTNNFYGIWASGTTLATITRNSIKVFENTTNQFETVGIRLASSTKFKVQENSLTISNPTPNINAKTIGIAISNSQSEANLVYKNDFEKLYIGGLSQGVNANTQVGSATGLVWQCNRFRNPMMAHDLAVTSNGSIAYNQGYMYPNNSSDALKRAANNEFSLTGESSASFHDFNIEGPSNINYVYTNGLTTIPDAYNANFMSIQQSSVNNSPVTYNYTLGCPSLLGFSKIELQQKYADLNQQFAADNATLTSGDNVTLAQTVSTGSQEAKKNALIAASPYVSDAILIQYISTNPSSEHLQQVLVANSPLTTDVNSAWQQLNLPAGVANSISNAQSNSISARKVLEQNMAYTQILMSHNFDDQLREVLLDSSSTRTTHDAGFLLQNNSEIIYKELLTNLRLLENDFNAAQTLIDELPDSDDKIKTLNSVLLNFVRENCDENYFTNRQEELLLLEEMSKDTAFPIYATRAFHLISQNSVNDDDIIFDLEQITRSSMIHSSSFENRTSKHTNLFIYPNPSKGHIVITNDEIDGPIIITDLAGKIIGEYHTTLQSTVLDLTHLKNGMYLIQVEDILSKTIYTNTLIIE